MATKRPLAKCTARTLVSIRSPATKRIGGPLQSFPFLSVPHESRGWARAAAGGPGFTVLHPSREYAHSCCGAGFGFSFGARVGFDTASFSCLRHRHKCQGPTQPMPLGMGERSEKGRNEPQERPFLAPQARAQLLPSKARFWLARAKSSGARTLEN